MSSNSDGAARQMTPEELVVAGFPADLHTRPGAYAEYMASKSVPVSASQHVASQPVKVSRNQTQYVRQQKGHSLILHLLLGWIVCYIPTIYFAVSPNHYFHA